jgi:ribonuclease BN (tRNA processing enzyme)
MVYNLKEIMKLTILGSGTCVPSLKRNASGYFLEDDAYRVLVDCGSGTLLQLEKAGKNYRDIDAVFITHSHPDHFADLMPLIHALLATPKFKREKSLTLFASGSFLEYFDKAVVSLLGGLHDFPITLFEIKDRFDSGPFQVLSARTLHSADSMAYRFECSKKSVVFTGDADYDQGIIELAKDADLLIADCSFPDALKAKGHLSAKECGLVAQKAGVKKLVLSHLYPADSPDIDRVYESRKVFNGEIVLSEDLMEFEI